ncbi:5-oxoprolinase subunit PxpA [Rhodococcus sp. WS4]|nr:5-oxoprolinase subunit PxpA [Rhodococcus sp. WS4]
MAVVSMMADIGESFGKYRMGDDESLLEVISDANVACGFHAGDPMVMDATVRACKAQGVSVGAHPGFRDLQGFGRRAITMSPEEIRTDVLYQLGALKAFATAQGVPLAHVTVHGKMDNIAGVDDTYAAAIVDAVRSFDPTVILTVQAGALERAGRKAGLRLAYTFMADRSYGSDGQPVSRDHPNALLHDPELVADRALRAAVDGTIDSIDGTPISMPCDVILVHGDNAESVTSAREVHRRITGAGIKILPIAEVLESRGR